MDMPKKDSDKIDDIISEIKSLHADLDEFRKGIDKIERAPKEKEASEVDQTHAELVNDLKKIADTIEELPTKWSSGEGGAQK
jgi:ElaB/YqjD/DUF883 family membrane-anchored ribosome-binding protein